MERIVNRAKLLFTLKEGEAETPPSLDAMGNQTVKVRSVGIYRIPMDKSGNKSIMHDFLIVEASGIPNGDVEKETVIWAEKTGTGIAVELESSESAAKFKSWKNSGSKVELSFLDLKIPMDDLLAILTVSRPHYNFLLSNCWKYADVTLLLVCGEAMSGKFGDLRPEDRDQIDMHIKSMDNQAILRSLVALAAIPGAAVVGSALSVLSMIGSGALFTVANVSAGQAVAFGFAVAVPGNALLATGVTAACGFAIYSLAVKASASVNARRLRRRLRGTY